MFVDLNLQMLNAYEVKEGEPITPTFNKEFLTNASFIFVQQKRVKFFDRIVKYNILFDVNSGITVYIPSAICEGREVDTFHNSTKKNFAILSDHIFDHDTIEKYKYFNSNYSDKQSIVIDRTDYPVKKMAESMYRKLKEKDTYKMTVKQKRLEEKQMRYKSHHDQFLNIRDKLSKELNDVLKKYDVKVSWGYDGEYGIIFKGESLYDESFMSLID